MFIPGFNEKKRTVQNIFLSESLTELYIIRFFTNKRYFTSIIKKEQDFFCFPIFLFLFSYISFYSVVHKNFLFSFLDNLRYS